MTQNNFRQPKMTKNDAIKQSVTDRPTDRPTDGAGCRVACTRLKSEENNQGVVENDKNQNKMQMRRKSIQEGRVTVKRVRDEKEEKEED